MGEENNINMPKLKLSDFTEESPDLWFKMAEVLFPAFAVETEVQKFAYLLQCLKMQQMERIRSIIENPGDAPYSTAKTKLLDVYGESPERKVRRLIESNAAMMVNLKPTLILDKIKSLGGDMITEPLRKEFWLERISPEVRLLITPSINLPIDDLAKQADSIAELLLKNKTNLSTAALNLSNSFNQPTPNVSVQPQTSMSQPVENAILLCMQEMTKELAAIRAERNTRSRSRTPNYRRYRSKSRERRDATPATKGKPELYNGLCWYHHTFGDRSYKCKIGCKEYNESEFGRKSEN